LRDEGYRVIVAANGRQGLALAQQAQQHRPRAILLDLSLPVTCGWEVIQQLRARERTRHIPVIALTERPEPALEADGQQPDVLVDKPFDLIVLLDHLARAVQPASPDGVWATEGHDAG
jgi:CheY-like chemotaxis protein